MTTLPSWEDCKKKVLDGNPSALELFIYDNEVTFDNAEDTQDTFLWREQLLNVINELLTLN